MICARSAKSPAEGAHDQFVALFDQFVAFFVIFIGKGLGGGIHGGDSFK